MTHPKKERTLVVIKPDGVQRTLIGEIIKRYERAGLKISAMKMVSVSPDFVEKHYTLDPNWKMSNGTKVIQAAKDKGLKPRTEDPIEQANFVLGALTGYLSSGPVVAMVLEGAHAVKVVRKITGGTEPLTSDVGSIRGDFVIDSYQMGDTDNRAVRNLVHASGSVSEAEMEIAHWFKKDEIFDYRLIQDAILYDVNIDGIME